MCGIAGFLDPENILGKDLWPDTLNKLGQAIIHRGPDAGDIWFDHYSGIGLCHRRLSILDLSPAGAQPMTSHSGRFITTFNGEIYNHNELRRDLDDVNWRGHSDTETLLAGFDKWGLEETIKKTVGMFAIAVWDKVEKILFLARDRLGEKPLYYYRNNGLFVFGSELKAIKAHPLVQLEINRDALKAYTQFSYVPTPQCIYKNISKLEQGSYLIIRGSDLQILEHNKYWCIKKTAENASRNRFSGDDKSAIELLEQKLTNTVKMQQLSDVPLGAFLSGGIDSSTIVSLMQKSSSRPIKTFTIGFKEKKYNEAEHAKAVAEHIGTDHTELYVSPDDAMAVIGKLPSMFDEPFSDASQIPTFLVAQLAKQHVTVSLSGDGGDELFGGYNRYLWANKISKYPFPLRAAAAMAINLLPSQALDILPHALPFLPKVAQFSDKARKLANILSCKSADEIYLKLISTWHQDRAEIVLGAKSLECGIPKNMPDNLEFEERLMLSDAMTYMADDILTKVDRASMAVSLESRVPFLDHNIVEFAFSLPLNMKIRNGEGKWILRQLLYKNLPREIMERPKMGFAVPINEWLRGPLKEWACSLLDTRRIKAEGYFNPDLVETKWQEHLAGRRNWQAELWNILMFQAWLEAQ